MWYHPERFAEKIPALKTRMALMQAVRQYFDSRGFWAVETSALQVMPSADKHIHGFETTFFGYDMKPKQRLYLHSSPEFDMKKLLVAGAKDIYQICKVYRNAETTRRHSPEFTMIEWYRAEGDYRDMMSDCEGLLRACAQSLGISEYRQGDKTADPFKEWQKISVAEAFQHYAGIDLDNYLPLTLSLNPSPFREREGAQRKGEGAVVEFNKAIAAIGIRTAPDDKWEDLFFRVMLEKIEPHLGMGVPTILYDYPSSMACLSRKKSEDPRYAERFELYVCGVELANAFTELTDAVEQRKRFTEEMQEKHDIYGFSYPLDEEFLNALDYGMPEAGGIALGLDRLVMLAVGTEDIDDVLWTRKPV